MVNIMTFCPAQRRMSPLTSLTAIHCTSTSVLRFLTKRSRFKSQMMTALSLDAVTRVLKLLEMAMTITGIT
jgi:hypothetical protein